MLERLKRMRTHVDDYQDPRYDDPFPPLFEGSEGYLFQPLRHLWYGDSETGKSMKVLADALTLVGQGRHVAYFDLENGEAITRERLRSFGVPKEQIREYFHYFSMPDINVSGHKDEFQDGGYTWVYLYCTQVARVELAVFDSVIGLLENSSLSDNEAKDIERLFGRLVNPLWKSGIATVVLDHPSKSGDLRGSIRKTQFIDVAFHITKKEDFDRDKPGSILFSRAKNRIGYADEEVAFKIGGQEGGVIVHRRVDPKELISTTGTEGAKTPTFKERVLDLVTPEGILQEKIVEALVQEEVADHLTKEEIDKKRHNRKAKVSQVLGQLGREGKITKTGTSGGRNLITLVESSPYGSRELEWWEQETRNSLGNGTGIGQGLGGGSGERADHLTDDEASLIGQVIDPIEEDPTTPGETIHGTSPFPGTEASPILKSQNGNGNGNGVDPVRPMVQSNEKSIGHETGLDDQNRSTSLHSTESGSGVEGGVIDPIELDTPGESVEETDPLAEVPTRMEGMCMRILGNIPEGGVGRSTLKYSMGQDGMAGTAIRLLERVGYVEVDPSNVVRAKPPGREWLADKLAR